MHTEIVWPMGGETSQITMEINQFLAEFSPLEKCLSVLYDQKSKANYVCCHLAAKSIREKMDFEATIYEDDLDDESSSGSLYKLNRDITENQYAFGVMKSDAQAGRSFEDIVVEYDKAYNSAFPLKIYGGQHRVKAILTAVDMDDKYHGFRIYFSLTKEQKVEIATVNNTSIAVSNDLIDRMKEQLLGTELRDFFQEIKLLEENQDFSDSKNGDVPTVRVARTFVLNYWRAKVADQNEPLHIPSVSLVSQRFS